MLTYNGLMSDEVIGWLEHRNLDGQRIIVLDHFGGTPFPMCARARE